MGAAVTIFVILGIFALGYFVFEDDDHDEWRG